MENELMERVGESKAALTEVFRNPGLRKVNLALAGSVAGDWAYAVGVSVFAYSHGGATAVEPSQLSSSRGHFLRTSENV